MIAVVRKGLIVWKAKGGANGLVGVDEQSSLRWNEGLQYSDQRDIQGALIRRGRTRKEFREKYTSLSKGVPIFAAIRGIFGVFSPLEEDVLTRIEGREIRPINAFYH